jgi:sugar/nucleoside kinase (ribokinase family)
LCLNAKEGAQELLDKCCKGVIVHQGARGSSWICNDFELSCPSRTVKPISLTGVGAVFNAGFIYAFLVGKEAEVCLIFADAYV